MSVRGKRGRAVAEQERLDPLAHLVHLGALLRRQPRHPAAGVRDDGHQPLGLETSQRFAHRHSAGAVPAGQFLLPDALAGLIAPAEDLLSERGGDPRAGLTMRVGALPPARLV